MNKLLIIALLSFSTLSLASVNLDAAYKREYIFLTTQLKELKKQRKNLNENYNKLETQAKKDLENLQKKVLFLNAKNNKLEKKVYNLEQNMELSSDNKTTLDNTLKQAAISLNIDTEKTKVSFSEIFGKAVEKLEKAKSISHSKGSFYLDSGEKVSGDITSIGKVASIGTYNNVQYVLAPAGNLELKVWKTLEEQNGVAPLFLYEKLEISAEKKKSQTIIEFVQAGGTIAWVIVAMGLFAVLLCIIRAINLKRYSNESNNYLNIVGNFEDLSNIEKETTLKTLVEKVQEAKVTEAENLDELIDEGMIHEHKIIDKYGQLILVFAAVAPLMGLLGTVTGMISTFDIITEFGTGDPKLLSQGISEALITTELGLIVAIPSLLLGNVLSGWGKNLKMNVDQLLLKLINSK